MKMFCGLWMAFLMAWVLAGAGCSAEGMEGGFELHYRLEAPEDMPASSVSIDDAVAVIERRLASAGKDGVKAQARGKDRVVITAPARWLPDKEEIRTLVECMGVLWFSLIARQEKADEGRPYRFTESEIDEARKVEAETARENRRRTQQGKELLVAPRKVVAFERLSPDGEKERFETIIETKDRISGRMLSKVYPTMNSVGQPAIGFELTPEGSGQLRHLTREENHGRHIAIVLDNIVYSAPALRATIGDRGIIEGAFTREEVTNLVIILKSGELPARLVFEKDQVIGR